MKIGTIELPRTAALAPVDNSPLPVMAHPHGNGLHHPPAVRRPVAGLYVHMQAGKAVGAVVPVAAAGPGRYHLAAADLTGENFVAGMGFVKPLFVLTAFVFPVHVRTLPLLFIGNSIPHAPQKVKRAGALPHALPFFMLWVLRP